MKKMASWEEKQTREEEAGVQKSLELGGHRVGVTG